MKTPTDLFKNQDLSKPINPELISSNVDCFGLEWDLSDTLCATCGSNKLCGIIFNKTTKRKNIQELEAVHDYLDLTEKITDAQFETYSVIVNASIQENGAHSAKDALEYFSILSRTKNPELLIEFLKTFCKKYNYKVINGLIKK